MSKIPSLINTNNSKDLSLKTNSINTKANIKQLSNSNLKHISQVDSEPVSKKRADSNTQKIKIPRVAYITSKSPNDSKTSKIKNYKKINVGKENILDSANSIKEKPNKLSYSNLDTKNVYKNSNRHCFLSKLSIRQQNLIVEREKKLEKTKLILKDFEQEYRELELSDKVTESELKFQLEQLEEQNITYLKEIDCLANFNKNIDTNIQELNARIKLIETSFLNIKELANIINNNTDLSQKIIDIEKTSKLLSEEIFESEKSIRLYELQNKDEILADSMKIPFNKSVEYALKLEKLIQNDKISINQLQFKLHKFTKKPRFVCRIYSAEINPISKISISIPSINQKCLNKDILNEKASESKYLCEKLPDLKKLCINHSDPKKLSIDIENKIFNVDANTSFHFDKIIEFDDSKRPSCLLLTDLSKIQNYLSNIMENKVFEDHLLEEFSEMNQKRNRNNILRRQSLLHSRTEHEFETQELSKFQNCFKNCENTRYFYNIDINEQKEVEMDILLLVNDMFNNIKLGLSEKIDLTNKIKDKNSRLYNENFSICFANIGSNSGVSRQTFWGTRNSRCVFVNEVIDNVSDDSECNSKIKQLQLPGILHSVIHQIYQNINSSSLFEWSCSADIFIQEINNENINKFLKDQNNQKEFFDLSEKKSLELEYYNSEINHFSDSLIVNCYSDKKTDCSTSEIYHSKTIKNIEHSSLDEFITKIYREIQNVYPNYLERIKAYNFSKLDDIEFIYKNDSNIHTIINLNIGAMTEESTINANITLVDLFITEDSTIDQCVHDYFCFVKEAPVKTQFIQYLYEINKKSQTKPLIYTLLHSNT